MFRWGSPKVWSERIIYITRYVTFLKQHAAWSSSSIQGNTLQYRAK